MVLYLFSSVAIISGVLLAALFGFRAWEIHIGRISSERARGRIPFLPARLRPEDFVPRAVDAVWDKGVEFVHTALLIFIQVVRSGAKMLSRLLLRVPQVEHLHRLVTGENRIPEEHKNGGASLYLKHITSHRDSLRKNKEKR